MGRGSGASPQAPFEPQFDGLLLFGSDRDLGRVRLSAYLVVNHGGLGAPGQLTVDLCLGVLRDLDVLGWSSQQHHPTAQSLNNATGLESLRISCRCGHR